MNDKIDEICKQIARIIVPDIIENYPDGDLIYASGGQEQIENLLKSLAEQIKEDIINDIRRDINYT